MAGQFALHVSTPLRFVTHTHATHTQQAHLLEAAIWRSAAAYVSPDTCTLPGKPVDSMRLAQFTLQSGGGSCRRQCAADLTWAPTSLAMEAGLGPPCLTCLAHRLCSIIAWAGGREGHGHPWRMPPAAANVSLCALPQKHWHAWTRCEGPWPPEHKEQSTPGTHLLPLTCHPKRCTSTCACPGRHCAQAQC